MCSDEKTNCPNAAEMLRKWLCGSTCGNGRKSRGIAEVSLQVVDFACGNILRKFLRKFLRELRKSARNPLISLTAEMPRNSLYRVAAAPLRLPALRLPPEYYRAATAKRVGMPRQIVRRLRAGAIPYVRFARSWL